MLKRLTSLMIVLTCLSASCFASDDTKPLQEFADFKAQHKGKVIYLDFWASWCTPCRKSFPWMNDMQAKYQQAGLVVVSVNLDSKRDNAIAFLQQTPADFHILYDEKGLLAKQFKLKGMPSSYLFNREGELVSAHTGFNGTKKALYEQEITQQLAQ